MSAVLDELVSVGKRVALETRIRPLLPDPNDEMESEKEEVKRGIVCWKCLGIRGAVFL